MRQAKSTPAGIPGACRAAALLLGAGAAVLLALPATAQQAAAGAQAPGEAPPDGYRQQLEPVPARAPASTLPRLSDGHPDFSGMWISVGARGAARTPAPLTPEYQAVRDKRQAALQAGKQVPDTVSTCRSFGMPRLMTFGEFEFVHKPQGLWMLTRVLHEVRRIHIGGTPFMDPLPSYNGNSVAHWEGNVLVVNVTDLRAGYFDGAAPHSDQMKIVQRLDMVTKDYIVDTITVTDPVALTKPWVINAYHRRQPPGSGIEEYICTEKLVTGILDPSDPESDPDYDLPKSAISQ